VYFNRRISSSYSPPWEPEMSHICVLLSRQCVNPW
jgi:hypothetical protein